MECCLWISKFLYCFCAVYFLVYCIIFGAESCGGWPFQSLRPPYVVLGLGCWYSTDGETFFVLVKELLIRQDPPASVASTTSGIVSHEFRKGERIKVFILGTTKDIPMFEGTLGTGAMVKASKDISDLPNLIKLPAPIFHGTTFIGTATYQ